MSRFTGTFLIVVTLAVAAYLVLPGCSVYYNLFFNCEQAFNNAERQRHESKGGSGGRSEYQKAIEKAQKVVENYPKSKYYDDALFILGVSFYHTGEFAKSERRFRELLAEFEDSKYTREATLYQAKAKLALGEEEDAMTVFSDIFESRYDRDFKAEAAVALGNFYMEEKDYSEARRYYIAVRDSLGNSEQRRESQISIADSYFENFQFGEALGEYLQAISLEPDKDQNYHCLFNAAQSSFRVQRIDDGLAYLDELIEDDRYYDSLGILKLSKAEGYEAEDDLETAEFIYDDVATHTESRVWQAMAWHSLGLIYQFDYDQLNEAKSYYDKAVEAHRSSDAGEDALQRSSDIGKLETFARDDLDSNATIEAIDEAAYTQYLLSELYWFKLNKRDTAILEMQYVVDSFPQAYVTPAALLALGEMHKQHYEDEEAADSLVRLVLSRYPHSDYAPEALHYLGLKNTAADTGYAELNFTRAERYLDDSTKIDSAIYNYQYIVDNYPDSRYYLQSRFNVIWLTDKYFPPGDSSVIWAYEDFLDSFPSSDLAREAQKIVNPPRRAAIARPAVADSVLAPGEVGDAGDVPVSLLDDIIMDETDPLWDVYHRDSMTLAKLEGNPIEILEPFEFPEEAARSTLQDEWTLYFQVLVDFSGQVMLADLKVPSGNSMMDELAVETVSSMTFSSADVTNTVLRWGVQEVADNPGHYWFVYEYKIIKPENLR